MLRNTVIVCAVACLTVLSVSLSAQNFRVQVAVFTDSVPVSYFTDRGLDQVYVSTDQNGFLRYFSGIYKTREEAEAVQQQLITKGFQFPTIFDENEQMKLCGHPCPYTGHRTYAEDPTQTTTVRHVYFDFGKTSLSGEAKKELDHMYQILKDNPKLQLKIFGYTDSQGSAEINIQVATRRSRTARNYLIEKGIHADRLFIKVFGELDPAKPNMQDNGKDSPEGRRQNRRVVLAVIDPTGEVQDNKVSGGGNDRP